mgnify:FL=1
MKDLVMQLSALSGVSSWEDEVRDFLRAEAAPYTQDIRTDALGNLIVLKKGKKTAGNKLLLCAHMDEVGLMVRHITDEGYLKFDTVGSIDRRVLLGKPVLIGTARLPGVIGLKAYHLVSRGEEKQVPKLDDYYIDIGARNREEAEKLVSLGDVAVFTTQPELFGDGLLKGKALDDRLGCAVLLTLLKEELPMDCTFIFTAQEEVGTRGAFGAAFSVTPELALVVEGTTAADLPDTEPHQQVCALGKGAVLTFMDRGSIADRRLFERLRALAEENGIPWQLKQFVSGSNDASAIQRTKAGVRTAVLSAPVRYIHAPASVACVSDLDAVLALARALVHDVAKEV